jgi:hypothetical protein
VRQLTVGKGFFVASAVELPLVAVLAAYGPQNLDTSKFVIALLWYHIVPISVLSFGSLWLFGHGSVGSQEPGTVVKALGWLFYWSFTFAAQAALTTPIVLGVMRVVGTLQRRRKPSKGA